MTANRGYIAPKKDQSAIGVHSLDHFTLTVPDLKPAQRFYSDFGLEVREDGNALALRTYSGEQRWARSPRARARNCITYRLPASPTICCVSKRAPRPTRSRSSVRRTASRATASGCAILRAC
jgi:hypothetical protein